MTKKKALDLLIKFIMDRKGQKIISDVVVCSYFSNNELIEWTYKGLYDFILKDNSNSQK